MIETLIQSLITAIVSFLAGYYFSKRKKPEADVPAIKKEAEPVAVHTVPKAHTKPRVVKFKRAPAWEEEGRVVRAEPKIMRVMKKDE